MRRRCAPGAASVVLGTGASSHRLPVSEVVSARRGTDAGKKGADAAVAGAPAYRASGGKKGADAAVAGAGTLGGGDRREGEVADGDTGAARAIVSGGYKRAGNKPLVKKSSAEALSCTGNTSVSYVPAVVLFVGPHVNPS